MKNAQMVKQDDYHKKTKQSLNSKAEPMVETITTNDRTPHTIARTTKINTQEIIAAHHPREIAPTPRCAARAAQAITTETAHHSMTTKISSRKLSRSPRPTQHHRKVLNTRCVTQPKLHSSERTRKDENIKRKDEIKKYPIKRPSHCTKNKMKLDNGILKTSI
jgi:hypothetical protein